MSKRKPTPTAADAQHSKEKIDVEAATLVGNMRDEILSLFKNHGEWKKLPEAKQRDVAAGAEGIAKDIVRRAAEIIAARGFQAVHGQLQSVMCKDGLKLVVTVSKNVDCRRDLIDKQGGAITLVMSDTSDYVTQRSEPEIDLDQPQLPIEEKSEEETKSKKKK